MTLAPSRPSLVVLRNSAVTGQWSMWNSADYIASAAAAEFEVQFYSPPVALWRLPLKRFRKFLLYFDIYVLGAIGVARAARDADLVAAADHGYAPALWLVPRRKRTAFVHDTIAMRQARGQIAGAPAVSWSGRIYQAWIAHALGSMPVLAANTVLEARYLRELGIGAQSVEVGQPAAEYRLTPAETSAFEPRHPYLLHVGSDTWIKNKAYLLEVCQALRKRLGAEAPTLIMAGRTGAATLDRIAALGLADAVSCISAPTDANLADLYSRARAVISTSHAEGFGVPPMEGLMFNRPLLLSDIPVFRHLYAEVARFIPLGDAHAAAECIARALSGDPSPPHRARQDLLARYSMAEVSLRTRAWLAAALQARAA